MNDPTELELLRAENAVLRFMCATAGGLDGLYYDDGELQDSREQPWIDWRRDSVAEIRDKLTQRALKDPRMVEMLRTGIPEKPLDK